MDAAFAAVKALPVATAALYVGVALASAVGLLCAAGAYRLWRELSRPRPVVSNPARRSIRLYAGGCARV